MVSPSTYASAQRVATKLETFGYKRCEPPADFNGAFGALWMFMESPEGRVTKIEADSAVDWKTGGPVDLTNGKPGPVPQMPPDGCMPKL